MIDDDSLIYYGLIDILFAHCYNIRTTEGEDTVESGWTVCKLSGTLCSFGTYKSVKEVGISCFRRALCYPLFRNYKLTKLVWKDLVILLKLGKRFILKSLLKVKSLLSSHDQLYILDRIFITDYCVWIQTSSDTKISQLASELNHYCPDKNEVGLGLVELEELSEKISSNAGESALN